MISLNLSHEKTDVSVEAVLENQQYPHGVSMPMYGQFGKQSQSFVRLYLQKNGQRSLQTLHSI